MENASLVILPDYIVTPTNDYAFTKQSGLWLTNMTY